MDIPSSGAIFTLGKSHLAENTQSYFYIKNDPVKRLISGPHQSAVICESGRLFVWGENHYGQLGIGGHSNKANNNNNSSNNNGDIVSKPTCVKSLKTLGLKINDAAFGSNWAVIMTLSNEVFFTGRNIFPMDTHVAQHFIDAIVEEQPCAIIRKPFRLEEFDDYLSKNEETDNFIAIQAGNEHFVVLTTKGRLIGCGSNAQQQLGDLEADYDGHPVEICLDAAVQQFACGPESTLVLTATGNLFLTGRLNEFVFPKFTELQKNLAQQERIIFMHISKASEIFIVTNVGSIYRSFESMRNKSLVFQRFYDYDSEENGPIWKLLKGFSFYAVLSKANKFFTTFSESGHHLKTFREISKFKNLRLLDIAVGDQHILVQGLPRSSTVSSSTGAAAAEAHSYMSRSFVLQPKEQLNGNAEQRSTSGRSLTKQKALETESEMDTEQGVGGSAMGASVAAMATGVATLEVVKHLSKEEAKAESADIAEQAAEKAIEINGNVAEASKEAEINGNVMDEAKAEEQQMEAAKEEPKETSEEQVDTAKEEQVETTKEEQIQSVKEDQVETAKPEQTASQVEAVTSTESPQKEEAKEADKEDNLEQQPPEPTAPLESPLKEVATSVATMESIAKLPTPPAESPSPQKSIASLSKEHLSMPNSSSSSSQEKEEHKLRPRTPYPDSSDAASTPQTIKKTPQRNFSYEAAMAHDELEKTSPELVDSLDTVVEQPLAESLQHAHIKISTPTPPTEEDEQLAVEITTTEDAEDSSKVVNEIRFINNGVDVTANVAEQMPDTPLGDSVEELEDAESEQLVEKMDKANETVGSAIETKLVETRDAMRKAVGAAGERMATGARDAVAAASNGARDAVAAASNGAQRMADGARDAVDAAGKRAQLMASDARQSMEQAGSNAAKAAANTKESMGRAMDSMTNKISHEVQGAKENISSLFQIKAAKEMHTPTTTPNEEQRPSSSSVEEEDERTTASVNSNHHSASNNGNNGINEFETQVEDQFDAVVERGKKAMQEELRALEEQRSNSHINLSNSKKSEERRQSSDSKGFVQQFLDGMRLSCRNEKAVQIEAPSQSQSTSQPPPHYSSNNKVNSELSLQNGQNAGTAANAQQSSRVCTIL
ncbi:hypothetical protein KR215_007440 [Drosophila sulfurigaster]|nr:hypothetical protein KR215_007440 [Drosophila sulfurigaster]